MKTSLNMMIRSALVALIIGLFGGYWSDVAGQSFSDREQLALALTTALGQVQGGAGNVTVPLTDITLKAPGNGCRTFTLTDVVTLNDLGSTISFELVWEPNGREMDVLEDAHTWVCDLNDWLFHVRAGRYMKDTNNSRGLAESCDVGYPYSDQVFYMIDGAAQAPEMQGGTAPPWAAIRKDPSGLILKDLDSDQQIDDEVFGEIPASFFRTDGLHPNSDGSQPIWFGKRSLLTQGQTDVLDEVRLAHSVLEFDYDHPEPGTEYAVAWGENKPRLDSIIMRAQMQAYPDAPGTNDPVCSEVSYPAYLSDRAKLIFVLHYSDIDANGVATRDSIYCENEYLDQDTDSDGNVDVFANELLWQKLGDFNDQFGWGKFHSNIEGEVYFEVNSSWLGTGDPDKLYLIQVRSRNVPAETCSLVFNDDPAASFEVDPMSGKIVYSTPDGNGGTNTEPVLCLDFCDQLGGTVAIANVLNASATTLGSDWWYDSEDHGTWRVLGVNADGNPFTGQPDNSFQTAERGKWRTQKVLTYRSDVVTAEEGGNRVYENAGVMEDGGNTATAFKLYNWHDESANDETRWLTTATVTQYAPSGEAVEQKDILGIHSSSRLAHGTTVPLLVASNAEYDHVDFTSFEEETVDEQATSGPTFETAHSGSISWKLKPNTNAFQALASVEFGEAMLAQGDPERGLLVKFWVKRDYATADPDLEATEVPVRVKVVGTEEGNNNVPVLLTTNGNLATFDTAPDATDIADTPPSLVPQRIYRIAQTGEWTLYQVLVDNLDPALVPDDVGLTLEIRFASNIIGEVVWVDDVRVQPLDASMMTYVYDRSTLALITQFDDQHFGTYYQYNGEGQLVRIKRETERGLRTVAETQYNVPLSARYVAQGGGTGISVPTVDRDEIVTRRQRTATARAASSPAARFDMANLSIGPDGPTIDLFGGKEIDFSSLETIHPEMPALSPDDLKDLAPGVDEFSRAHALNDIRELNAERARLMESIDTTSEAGRQLLASRMGDLEERRRSILVDRLGMNPDEIDAFYARLREQSEEREVSRESEESAAEQKTD